MIKRLDVVRLEQSDQGALGALLIDGILACWTLQPDKKDDHFYILEEAYIYQRFHSAKHPDTFEIIVPGHTALLFHAGNTEYDTQGCILLGSGLGYINDVRAVLRSKYAFNAFMLKMGEARSGPIYFWDSFPKDPYEHL